jgi:hypothetical protein
MSESMRDAEQRLALLKKEVLKRGFNHYPSVFTRVSDLPFEFQSPELAALIPNLSIQKIIVFPPQIQRGWDYVPKQALLFSPTEVVYLKASIWPDQEPQIIHLKAGRILYVRATLILLYGFLEIVAQGDTSPTRLAVEFNTIAWNCLSRPLRQLLIGTAQVASGLLAVGSVWPSQELKVNEELPIKFSNGMRIHGLLPGEELEELVFQPGAWKRWLFLMKRPLLANTLVLLTSHYLVVLEEDLKTRYGWIISYIMRDSITGLQNRPCGPWNELKVVLGRENQGEWCVFHLQDQATRDLRECWLQHGGQWQELAPLSHSSP